MRALAPLVALAFLAAGCSSTYRVRPDELERAVQTAGSKEPTVPALDDEGRSVELRVLSILSGEADPGGRLEVIATDGRKARLAGWGIVAAGLVAGTTVGVAWESDVSSLIPALFVAFPFALAATPFLVHGYTVGSPER